jgi:peroxiredoxin
MEQIQRLHKIPAGETPIIMIKTTVFDIAAPKLIQVGFRVVPIRIPFPAQRWQQRFRIEFAKALKKAGLR